MISAACSSDRVSINCQCHIRTQLTSTWRSCICCLSTFARLNSCLSAIFSCSRCLICCCNSTWSLIEGKVRASCGEGGDDTEELVGYDQDLKGGGDDDDDGVSFSL